MGLPVIKVKGFGKELELNIKNVAQEKSTKEVLGLKTIHKACGGDVGMKLFCKDCGEEFPKYALQDKEGNSVIRQKQLGAVFEVLGVTDIKALDYRLVSKTYFCEIRNNLEATAALVEALGKRGVVGYLRLRADSDERPAALFSPDGETLVLSMLFYGEIEADTPVPVFGKGEAREVYDFMQVIKDLKNKDPYSIDRREVKEIREIMEKPVERGV